MGATESAQSGMWDRELPDPEGNIADLIDGVVTSRQAANNHAALKRQVKKLVKAIDLQHGERIRVGRFVLTGERMGGGGYSVDDWRVIVPKIRALD